jgi:hypothetical protein
MSSGRAHQCGCRYSSSTVSPFVISAVRHLPSARAGFSQSTPEFREVIISADSENGTTASPATCTCYRMLSSTAFRQWAAWHTAVQLWTQPQAASSATLMHAVNSCRRCSSGQQAMQRTGLRC